MAKTSSLTHPELVDGCKAYMVRQAHHDFRLVFLVGLAVAISAGCGKSKSKRDIPPPPSIPNPVSMSSSSGSPEVPSYQKYAYAAGRWRDPFIPLVGSTTLGARVPTRPPNINMLFLKGVMKDNATRLALLSTGSASYILKGGRLYDVLGRKVPGISGVVRENSVVLMSGGTVRELKGP